MKRNWLAWMPLLGLAFVAGLAIFRLANPNTDYVSSEMVGKPLPEFTLSAATDGVEGLATANFRDGKPRMLNIFASWCLPCQAEAPYLEQLKAAGVEFHAIAIRDKPEDVAKFLAQNGNPFVRIGADQDMLVQLQLGSSGVPETYIIDGKGRIAYQHIGDIREEHVAPLLKIYRSLK